MIRSFDKNVNDNYKNLVVPYDLMCYSKNTKRESHKAATLMICWNLLQGQSPAIWS